MPTPKHTRGAQLFPNSPGTSEVDWKTLEESFDNNTHEEDLAGAVVDPV
jgi:hypothetical protein